MYNDFKIHFYSTVNKHFSVLWYKEPNSIHNLMHQTIISDLRHKSVVKARSAVIASLSLWRHNKIGSFKRTKMHKPKDQSIDGPIWEKVRERELEARMCMKDA